MANQPGKVDAPAVRHGGGESCLQSGIVLIIAVCEKTSCSLNLLLLKNINMIKKYLLLIGFLARLSLVKPGPAGAGETDG